MIDVPEVTNSHDGPLSATYKVLERGAWDEAAGQFRAALTLQETAEAWEGLGLALWWLNDLDGAFDARERAYSLFRARGDRRPAGLLSR